MADNFSQFVKDNSDIVKIIGEYVKLRKTGAQNYSGLCPFHKEKTGSFSVNALHKYFYCFGCHEKGDVFTFVMKLDGLSFPEAVRAVAVKAGIPLPKKEYSSAEEAQEAGIRKKLVDLHEAATQYFEAQLKSPGAAGAREYLSSRGVTAETIAKFRMGFAPDDFNDMREKMKAFFGDDVLRASGLFNSSEKDDDGHPTGQLYARFRKRVMFPIANEQGKTIAFTARALEAVDDKGRPIAKYMNSPETPLYTKGNVLFNLDKAKADMRAHDFALLVEGQMDCISVYMAGIKNVLATSGTAFTEMQVRLLSRFTKRVVVNFDPDQAGATAAEKSIALLTEEGFEVKVISLDGGLDPDRFVRENGIQAYMAALRTAKRHTDYLIERAIQLFPPRSSEAKLKAMNFLLPHMRRMKQIHRDEFIGDAVNKLGIDSSTLREELRLAASKKLDQIKLNTADLAGNAQRIVIRALLLPSAGRAHAEAVKALTEHPDWFYGLPTTPLFEYLATHPIPENPLDIDLDIEDSQRAWLASILAEDLVPEKGLEPRKTQDQLFEVTESLATLHIRSLERRQRELRVSMAEAQRRGDEAMVDTLMQEKIKVDRALREH